MRQQAERSSSASSARTVEDETSQPGALDERLRADRLPGRDVLLDHVGRIVSWRGLRRSSCASAIA